MSRHVTPKLTKRSAELVIGIIDAHWSDVLERFPQRTWRDHNECDDVCREAVSDAYALIRAKDALEKALEAELRLAS